MLSGLIWESIFSPCMDYNKTGTIFQLRYLQLRGTYVQKTSYTPGLSS